MPRGPGFGTPAPDAGYGLRLIRGLEEEIDPDLAAVLAALMTARASHFGRAPVIQDIEVAKLLVGMGDGLPTELVERATRWTDAVPHEVSKGRSAVDGVDVTQLAMSPDALRTALVSR